MRIISGTIIPPTTPLPPVSSQAHLVPNLLPWEMRVQTQSLPSISPHHKRRELPGESNRDGFHPPIHRAERGSEHRVGSYEGTMRGGESETLSVFIPEEEMGTIDSDLFVSMIDEASGRVLIWRWDDVYNTRRVYIHLGYHLINLHIGWFHEPLLLRPRSCEGTQVLSCTHRLFAAIRARHLSRLPIPDDCASANFVIPGLSLGCTTFGPGTPWLCI